MTKTNAAQPADPGVDIDSLPNPNEAAWVRVGFESSGSIAVSDAKPESEIIDGLARWQNRYSFAVKTLGDAIDSLKKSIEYNGLYNSMLMGQISENEFEIEAQNYIFEPLSYDAQNLYDKMNVLITYTTSDFTESELSEIFHATEKSVHIAVEQLRLDFDGIEQGRLPFLDVEEK